MTLESLRRASRLLSMLNGPEFEIFASFAEPVSFAEGKVLFAEDAPADRFYIVDRGRVGLELTTPGKQPIVLQTLGSGELVGISWMFPPYRWSWRARALIASDTYGFDAPAVRAAIAANPELGYRLAAAVAEEAIKRLHGARLQLLDLYRSEAP
jgi:CRP/FNR family cyclic AMP-dependent transcriptional regulator